MQPTNSRGLNRIGASNLLSIFVIFARISTNLSVIKGLHAKPVMTTNIEESSNIENQPTPDPIHTIHYHFDKQMEPLMHLHRLDNAAATSNGNDLNNITCNDGSQPAYYKRLNNHSKSWIVYLQGGGYCGSEEACQHRWNISPSLMSSNYWPKTKSVDGILSSEPKDNPYLWNANHIYIPYCSSDSWTGHSAAGQSVDRSFAFMGSKIIERVFESLFEDLPRESSLYEAKFILLAGDSAGATGVILNLDRVNRLVQQRFNSIKTTNCSLETSNSCEPRSVPIMRGLADSGWFLDNEPYDFDRATYEDQQQQQHQHHQQQQHQQLFQEQQSLFHHHQQQQMNEIVDCDRQRCTPIQSIRQAMLYWNGQVPAACSNQYQAEPWRCYFGYRAYQTLKTPLFVVQWLYDEAQLMVDNIGRPDSDSQWSYVGKVVSELRSSLENVTALFAPSCFSHSLITKLSWNQININGFKLPHILNRWEEENLAQQPTLESLATIDPSQPTTSTELPSIGSNQLMAAPPPMERSIQNYELRANGPSVRRSTIKASNRSRNRKRKRQNQQQQQNARNMADSNRLSRSTGVDETTMLISSSGDNVSDGNQAIASANMFRVSDKFRLIDSCGWPQCNRDCPIINAEMFLRPLISY